MNARPMTSSRPYIVRALFEWIVDNDLTPYLLVNANGDEVVVPRQYVENGKIVLNIRPGAVSALSMENDAVSFSARFSGRPWNIWVPTSAILAIYAKENGKGMMFPEEDDGGNMPPPSNKGSANRAKRPNLRVVK